VTDPASAGTAAPLVDPGGEILLDVSNLSKDFGGLRAVSALSFRAREGEFVGVIGPNGAGKTTLFALLSGFLPATGGEIRFRGVPTGALRTDQLCHQGMARTFQVVRPFPEMTVFENVKVAAVFGKKERPLAAEIRRGAEEALACTGLSSVAALPARSLNLPQRKRLEMARALATRPKLLLLDEVLAGLNPREVEDAIPFVRSLNAERGITVLMIEHNLRAIMGLSHRILVLNFGQLIFDGAPEDAVKDPGVVQAYLGERNDA
jgi:branched-chain amino acid transport system ATP-binding protein